MASEYVNACEATAADAYVAAYEMGVATTFHEASAYLANLSQADRIEIAMAAMAGEDVDMQADLLRAKIAEFMRRDGYGRTSSS